MNEALREKRIREWFRLSVLLKGAHAVVELIGGVLLFLVPLSALSSLAVWLTSEELLDDPHDLIANYVLHLGNQLTVGGKMYGGLYLLSHGVIKLILVVALLRDKLWAYPWSLGVLGAFIVYQLYRCTLVFSIPLLLLSVFDLAVMWLIWMEYQIVRSQRRPGN